MHAGLLLEMEYFEVINLRDGIILIKTLFVLGYGLLYIYKSPANGTSGCDCNSILKSTGGKYLLS